jgi:hypothetical protein
MLAMNETPTHPKGRSMSSSIATAALQADQAAKKTLIARHQEEFTMLLADEREARGLPRARGNDKRATITPRLATLEKKMTELRAELEKLS